MEKIIIVDFAGTLIKAEMIEEANVFRAKILERELPTKQEHAHAESFYAKNREFVEKLTGISSSMKMRYRENSLEFMDLSGTDVQNQIASNLFQIGMYMMAKKHGLAMIPNGLIQQLQRCKRLGYRLAIVSGVRTDIISGVLQIAQVPIDFDYIYGQPPKLGLEDQEPDVHDLTKKGNIIYCLGDKKSDLERVKGTGAKTIFVTWGHAEGGEAEIADYVIENAEELEKIIH